MHRTMLKQLIHHRSNKIAKRFAQNAIFEIQKTPSTENANLVILIRNFSLLHRCLTELDF